MTVTLRIDNKEWVDVGQVEVNGDKWHEIVGSFRIERKPAEVVVYVHGPDSGVDLMLRDEIQISAVDRKARFEKLRSKTDEVIYRRAFYSWFICYLHWSRTTKCHPSVL